MYRADWKGQTQSSMVGGGGRRRYAWVGVGDGQNGTGLAGTKADRKNWDLMGWQGVEQDGQGQGCDSVSQSGIIREDYSTLVHLPS